MLQAGTDGVLLVERIESLAAAGPVDEDDLGLEGELGNGIVVLEDDLVGTARISSSPGMGWKSSLFSLPLKEMPSIFQSGLRLPFCRFCCG